MNINRVTLQRDKEFIMLRFYFSLFMVLLFTRVILSTPACDVYAQLKTSGEAIKIAWETTNNQ